MRLVASLVLSLLGSPALAAGCDRWSAAMQEDEGGPVMTAQICVRASASPPEAEHILLVQCGGGGELAMRYLPFAQGDYPPGGNEEFETDMQFSLDGAQFTEAARFEGMDGAMAMATRIDGPLAEALKTGKQVTVSDPGGKVPAATFTLAGSRGALEKLAAGCTP